MKRKHFIIALVAMLLSFSVTTSADELLVNCDYNSSTEGYGVSKFSNYAGAYAYATANATNATIVIEKTNTLSGNTFDNNHKNYSKLAVVIKDGATMGNAASKWDMTYPVTVEPGGTLTCARPASSSVSYIHIKNKLIVGAKGSTKKAVVDFLSDTYQDCDISIRYNGSIEVYNADFKVQDLDAQGKLTIEDSKVEVDGAFASATFYATTLTNTEMVVNGNQISGGLSDFSGGTSNQLGYVKINNSTLTIKEGTTKVAATVTATNSTIAVNDLTVNTGITLNLNEGSTLEAENITTAGTGSVKIDGNTAKIENGQIVNPVAQIGTTKYYSLAEAAAAATAGNEIVMLADETLAESLTLPAGITFNGNGKQINGTLVAAGDITFAGVTKVGDLDFGAYSTEVTIPAGASLQLNGSARMSIGFGTTFNITGTIENAKIADKATLTPSLVIPGASFSGTAGVTFNVTNAYISVPSSYCNTSKTASGTFDFNITNSIWESAGKLAFEEQSVNAKVDFALVNSVLTTGSHLVFGTASGEKGVVIDNSLVNEGTSRQLENCGKMTIKNGSVVNGAVATSSNAKNPGTVIVENATYAVTGEFSGSDLGTGTLIIKKGANVSAGSITKANITVDAEGMTAGDVVNLTANLANLAGELSVINNDKLEAKIVNGKVVLAAKPVAKIGETPYTTLEAAFAAAAEGATITLLADATPALTSQRAITKAAVIDLGGKTLTLKEDDLYFGTTKFQNGTIVVDPSVKPSTAVFWMFANQTLTFDNVKIVATGVTGTYLIGLEGENSDLNLLNGSEILVENTTALDLDIICVNGTNTCDIKVENSKVNVANIDGRVFFRGNYTVKDSEVNLAGITKAGFRIEAGQTLSIEGTSKVNIEGEPRDGGIHMTDLSATYTKAETATVNATVNEPKVAQIGETTYKTLQAAIEAVQEGETIILVDNVNVTTPAYGQNALNHARAINFTLDLNGKTLSANTGNSVFRFNIANSGATSDVTLTIKNGKIVAGSNTWCAVMASGISADVKAIMNLENLTIEASKAGDLAVKAWDNATINANNVTVNATNAAGGFYAVGGEIVLDECTVNQKGLHTAPYLSMAFAVSTNGKMTVNSGTYSAEPTVAAEGYNQGSTHGSWVGGVMNSGGELIINGGTFSNGNFGDDALATAARGLIFADTNGEVTVNGGTFNALKSIFDFQNNLGGTSPVITVKGGNYSADPAVVTSYGSIVLDANYVVVDNNGVWNVVKAVAKIGTQKYASLQEAVNAVQNGETITLTSDVTENVTLTEKVGLYYTIDGDDGKTMTGTITVSSLSDTNDNRRITIKNINFVDTANGRDFITSTATNHYPRITVEGCSFTGTGKEAANSVAVRLKSSHSVVIKDCTGTGLHSFLQNTSGWNLTIENVKVTESKSGFALGTVQGVTVQGVNVDVKGYGIRMDAQYNNNAVLENNTVKAFIPVVVRKAEVNSDVTVKGENTMTATNTDGIWFAAGTSEYETNGQMPTAATGEVKVTLEDKTLDLNGVYGNYGVASIGNAKFNTLAEAVNAAQAGSEIKLLADVTLAGGYEDAAEGLRIEKEITLNGNGYTINCGNFLKGIRVYNPSNVSDFNVNFNNVKVVNNVANGRCIDTRSGNINLKVNSSTLIATNGNSQPLTIGGNDPVHRVTLNKTTINAGASGYAVISFVSTNVDISGTNNSTISGFAAFYLKGDAKTTTLNLGQGVYTGTNNHAVESGVFGTIVLEGDNNVVNLMGTNATVKAVAENTAPQAAFLVRGANNTIKITKESAKIITEGNAYEAMVKADNAATTKFVDMGIERKLVAENRGYQFYSFEEAVRFAGNEGTIKVVNDFELAEAWTVAAGQNITLDLNGKTVSYTSAVAGEDMITNRGNFTITDSSDAKTGKLTYVNTDATASNVTVSTISSEPGSVLNITGGTVENKTVKADGSSIYSFAIDMLTNGNLGDVTATIAGGTVSSDYMAIRQFNNGTACKNTLNINGGYIYGAKRAVQVHLDNNAAYTTISGGKVEAGADGYAICNFAATGNLEVTGGEFTGAVYSARENFISGGTYNSPVEAAYCAEGYMPNKNADGTYGVVVAKDVYASIDGVTYASLADAITAAKAGETITFLQNITEDVTIGKSITIDGANKKYTGNIQVQGGNAVATIKNVNFVDGSGYAVKTNTIKNITIENCTVTGYNFGFLYANKSTATITVKDVTIDGGSYGLNWNYGTTATLEDVVMTNVKYGIYTRNYGAKTFTIKNCDINATTPIYIDEKGTAKQTFAFEGVNNLGKTPAELSLSQYAVINGANVGTYYGTLQSMVEKAENGQTVKMLSDIAMTEADCVAGADRKVLVDVAGKNITLDMNGKTISVTHMDEFTNDYIVAVIRVADGAGLTVTGNGTIDVKVNEGNPDIAYMFWKRGTTGYLTIENGTFKMNDSADSMVYTNGNESVFVKGGTWTLDSYGTRGNREPWIFNVKGSGDNHVVVTGGTYNADINRQHWSNEVLVPETYYTVANADGTYTVNEGAVAYVNEGMLTGPFFVKKNIGYATLAEAIAEVDDDETVTMLKDVTLDETLVVAADKDSITLDLAGKTINAGWDDETAQKHIYAIDNKGNLVIKGNGTINARGIYNYGELTLNGATINAIDANGGYAVKNFSGAKFTMEAGTIATTNEDGDVPGNGYDATTVQVDEGAEFIMNGGEIKNISNYTSAIVNYGTTTVKNGKVSSVHSTLANHGTMTIDGGEFTCDGLEGITAQVIWATDASTTTINGGTFDGKDNYNGFNVNAGAGAEVIITGGNFLKSHSGSLYGDGNIAVSGGFFYEAVPNKYCAADYRSVEVADGRYTVERFCFHFVDGEFTEYVNDKDVENATITYKRANIPTTWTAFYVPFEVPVKVLADQGFEVAYINGVRRDDKNEDGVLDDEGFAMEVIYIHGGDNCDGSNKTLKANYPYFIRTKGSKRKNLEIKLEGRTLYAAKDATYDCTTMTEKFEITGISSQKTLVNVYGVAGGEWSLSTVPQTMKPFRFYMLITSRENSEPVIITSPMRIVVRGEELENGETLIYDIEESKGHSADRIFDLQGRRVLSPVKGNLYIINGKKVVY